MWNDALTVVAVFLAVALALVGTIWAGIRLLRWYRRNRGAAAETALHLYLQRERSILEDLLDDD
ncbi:MAG: hypothetical protein L0Y66_08390 [Myxococcaceae bacterium]|nr:hypothetical protein [Myxococcaceae bacterium]MCI0670904.1 hypothetical protein [Myxococcaceae bacterium]